MARACQPGGDGPAGGPRAAYCGASARLENSLGAGAAASVGKPHGAVHFGSLGGWHWQCGVPRVAKRRPEHSKIIFRFYPQIGPVGYRGISWATLRGLNCRCILIYEPALL